MALTWFIEEFVEWLKFGPYNRCYRLMGHELCTWQAYTPLAWRLVNITAIYDVDSIGKIALIADLLYKLSQTSTADGG